MSNQETEPTKYSPEYFAGAFPPNHNPIVGHNHLDTISNVYSALCFIRETYEAPDYESEKDTDTGLFFILTCLIHGLRFEMENRG